MSPAQRRMLTRCNTQMFEFGFCSQCLQTLSHRCNPCTDGELSMQSTPDQHSKSFLFSQRLPVGNLRCNPLGLSQCQVMRSKCLRSIIRLELITHGRAASACLHTCVLPQAGQYPAAWCLPRLASWHGFSASAASPETAKCWQCGQLIAGSHAFFCPKCRSLQPPPRQPDYFAIMGM